MARKRFLPKYVSAFRDRHGKIRHRFRKKGSPSNGKYFTEALGTEEFRQEYKRLLDATKEKDVVRSRAKPGSVADLRDRYFATPDRLGPSKVTQQKNMAVIEDFCAGREDRMIAQVRFDHLDAIIAKKRVKTVRHTPSGEREIGGFHAAVKLRKELIRFFRFAKQVGMIKDNPAEDTMKVRRPRSEVTKGFHTWTEQEIDQFRSVHPLGSRERLAMELLLWTDQRRSDVVKMGMSQTRDGCIPITQEKTGATLWLPLAPQLVEAIVAMPPELSSPFCFLVTKRGKKPFTKESFGNFFRAACNKAGLPQCSAHGLRKATLRRMAELEMPNKTMKSVSGQERDETLAGYIRDADQRRLAVSAIERLSAWERGELGKGRALNDG